MGVMNAILMEVPVLNARLAIIWKATSASNALALIVSVILANTTRKMDSLYVLTAMMGII